MRAGQKIMMIAPGDTEPYPVPREFAAKMREAGAKWYTPTQNKNTPLMDLAAQPDGSASHDAGPSLMDRASSLGKRAINATPDVMGGIGGMMGVNPHMRAANAARLGTAGRAISHVANTIIGEEESWTPQQAAEALRNEAARQAAMGYSGELVAKGGKMLAEPVMKSAIGRSAVGTAKRALKYGLAPTERFLAATTAKIGKLKDEAVALAGKLERSGHTTTFDELAKPVRAAMARFKRHDITGSENERAMQAVLDEMQSKIGPVTVATPGGPAISASQTATSNPSANLRGVFSTQWQKPTSTQIPAAPLTPTQLQEINQIARQKLTDLFNAKQGKIGVPPDPRELAYMKVWARSKQLLEGMGGKDGKRIGALNKQMQRLYQMHDVAKRAGERVFPSVSPYEAIGASGIAAGAVASGHPEAALFAIPAAIGRPLLTRPDALAAQARFLDSKAFETGARVVPRIPGALLRQMSNPPKDE